jgi:hypothetical protein
MEEEEAQFEDQEEEWESSQTTLSNPKTAIRILVSAKIITTRNFYQANQPLLPTSQR